MTSEGKVCYNCGISILVGAEVCVDKGASESEIKEAAVLKTRGYVLDVLNGTLRDDLIYELDFIQTMEASE